MRTQVFRGQVGVCLVWACMSIVAMAANGAGEPARDVVRLDFKFACEQDWIVGQITADICGMAAVARDKPVHADFVVRKVEAKPSADGRMVFLVDMAANGSVRATTMTIAGGVHVWDPAGFTNLASGLLKGVTRGVPPAASATNDLVGRLLEPRSARLIEEDRRISALLTANMLDADAHEQAALLLGSFALREHAGMFTDTRPALSRLSAHLAMAGAIRAGTPAGICGQLADVCLQTLAGRQAAAVAALDGLSSAAAGHSELVSWCKALRMRNTFDWRLLKDPAVATLFERLAYFNAKGVCVSADSACELLESREPEEMPDWACMSMEHAPGVAVGNDMAQIGIKSVLKDFSAAWSAMGRKELTSDGLITGLDGMPGYGVSEGDNHLPAVQVIGAGAWGAFSHRHLMHLMVQVHAHVQSMLGLPEDAVTFARQMGVTFGRLSLFPLAEKFMSYDSDTYLEGMSKGGALCSSRPDRVPFVAWFTMRMKSPYAAYPGGMPLETGWFAPAIPWGTAYDVHERMLNHERLQPLQPDIFDDLGAVAPYDATVCRRRIEARFGTNATPQAVAGVYGPLVEYNVSALAFLLSVSKQEPAAYLQRLAALCELQPGYYAVLAEYQIAQGNKKEAAAAYLNAFEKVKDRVGVSNNMRWLVDYLLDVGQTNRAAEIAEDCGETFSSEGLATKAHYLVRVGQFTRAEEVLIQAADRYHSVGGLFSLYRDHQDARSADGQSFQSKMRILEKRIFPGGMRKVDITKLSGPPARGVLWASSTEASVRFGLRRGIVIVAIDGILVESEFQYIFVRDLHPENPKFDLVFWNGRAYQQVVAEAPSRSFGVSIEDYGR